MAARLAGIVALAIVVSAACSESRDVRQPSGADGRREGVVGLPIEESLDRFLDSPNATHAALLASQMGEDGRRMWVPYLVDILRMGWSQDSVAAARTALAAITDMETPDEPVDAYVTYGSWMYDESPDPGQTYLLWKQVVYALVDPGFVPLLRQVTDPVLASRLQWGGVARGGIPALHDPAAIAGADAEFMVPAEIVFGVVLDGRARAYPLRILGHHELANDELAGRPVALTFCSLCRAAVLFDRRIGGEVLTFETSGLLHNSNKVMVDDQTESLWQQLSGKALAGSLEGETLRSYATTTTTWAEWIAEHPGTDLLALPDSQISSTEGFFTSTFSYEPGDAYREYFESDEQWFPSLSPPPAFPTKAEVATIERDGGALAVLVKALQETGPVVLEVGDAKVVVVPTGPGARFFDGGQVVDVDPDGRVLDSRDLRVSDEALVLPDGTSLARLRSGQAYWFAWYAEHPDTTWWPETAR